MKLRFSIRLQLLFLSTFLFAIPWLGYKYVWELEGYLRIGQEQSMIGTARAVATALHERPALFDSQSSYLKNVRPGTDLYAPPISAAIQLDGKLRDWNSVDILKKQYGEAQIVKNYSETSDENVSLSFEHMVGRQKQYLYAMFSVNDDRVIWRQKSSLAVDQSDHLLIGLTDTTGKLYRYIISPYVSGWVNAYRLSSDQLSYQALDNELNIQGRWLANESGYTIELRFPLDMTSGSLAFAIVDVDDPITRQKKYAIGTANPNQSKDLGTVITPSPEIEQILSGLKYSDSRVWVIDKHKRVLARSGNITSVPGLKVKQEDSESRSWLKYIEKEWLHPIYYKILTRPPADFVDELDDAYKLAGKDINSALTGKPDSLWRLTPDNKAVILSAAHPIFIDEKVMGAVVVEQTTNGIRTLRNRALEELFNVILAVMLLASLGSLLFANRISSRIRKLRDGTESVIDDNGKIIGTLTPSRHRDEIGDLSRTFSNVLSRLHEYNSYLEKMASRLSHELRTPVAVVRSSLDILNHVSEPEKQQEFIERAQTGINRLSSILNSMSEATRLEQAIAQEEKEEFDLVTVIKGTIEGYQQAYTHRHFAFKQSVDSVKFVGSPELISQMLDKLIANAIEFSENNTSVSIHLWQESKKISLSVTNIGSLLPEDMKDQLVHSMVSVRKETSNSDTPHLGLGLYIANMIVLYHGGNFHIDNLPDNTGVCAVVTLPNLPSN